MKVEDLLIKAGWPTELIPTAKAIVAAESSNNTHAFNGKDNDESYGLFQINMKDDLGPTRRYKYGLKSNEDLYDPLLNAKIALDIFKSSGNSFRPWSAYNDGRYKQFLGSSSGTPSNDTSTEKQEPMPDYTNLILELLKSAPSANSQSMLPDQVNIPGINRSANEVRGALPLALTAMLTGDDPTAGAGKMLIETLGSLGLKPSGNGSMLDVSTGNLFANPYVQEQNKNELASNEFARRSALANTLMMMSGRQNQQDKKFDDQVVLEGLKHQFKLDENKQKQEIKAEQPRKISDKMAMNLSTATQSLGAIDSLINTLPEKEMLTNDYSTGFGIGPLQESLMGLRRRTTAAPGVGENIRKLDAWWQTHNGLLDSVERHELFGASFTAPEQKIWNSTHVQPGAHPDVIRRSLSIRKQILANSKKRIEDFAKTGDPSALTQELPLDTSFGGVSGTSQDEEVIDLNDLLKAIGK